MSQRTIIFILIAVIAAIYPFLIYFGLSKYGIRPLAIVLLLILSLRVILWQQFKRQEKVVLVMLVFLLCGFAAWLQNEALLRFYPVLMNTAFGVVFLLSLRAEQPLLERIMSLVMDEFSEPAKRYLRGLTLVWGIVLLINAVISFYTACCLSLRGWTIYNGAIAYIIFGVFALGELVYRHYYKKRYEKE